ncbi:MAG: LCP family protein [Bifidobacteriaceae bacterium]|jgi:LCP family protein required for cell wall assembly|nr:LCP family protein [Bifidobacteriaceae bacterium]MCI1978237.1 LCP family protein [Bifidobacteriaceae bacterium]
MASPAHSPKRAKDKALPNLAHTPSNEPLHAVEFAKTHRVRTIIVSVVIALLGFVGTFAAATYLDIANTVKSAGVKNYVTGTSTDEKEAITDPNSGKPVNIVLLGQDTRDGAGNSSIGGSLEGEHNADTTMIVQIAADRSYINLVSIPRDSIVDQPACTTSKGTMAARSNVMFNSIFAAAYQYGGDVASAASCTTTALADLTGIDLSLFIVADFQGLKKMIDVIGGVDLCIPQDVSDSYTGLKLSKGLQHLDGTKATQYARLRHGMGDGSDIMRTVRQQYLIKAVISQVLSKNLLTNSDQLYQLVHTGISALQMSETLADLSTLAGLAGSLSNFSTSHLYSRTVPTEAYPGDLNRVQWASGASELWKKMKNNEPISKTTSSSSTSSGSSSDSTSSNGSSDSSSTSSDTDSSTSSNATTEDSNSSSPSSSSDSDSDSSSGSSSTKVDSKTGLYTDSNGQLIDPKTGGIVDPETGVITDPDTGYAMGYADQYLSATVCAVTAQN